MTDKEPDRPIQVVLDDAICEVITQHMREWDVTAYDVVGVLHTMAARYAHMTIVHNEDD